MDLASWFELGFSSPSVLHRDSHHHLEELSHLALMTHILIFREEPIDSVATPMEDVIEDLQDFSSWYFFCALEIH